MPTYQKLNSQLPGCLASRYSHHISQVQATIAGSPVRYVRDKLLSFQGESPLELPLTLGREDQIVVAEVRVMVRDRKGRIQALMLSGQYKGCRHYRLRRYSVV